MIFAYSTDLAPLPGSRRVIPAPPAEGEKPKYDFEFARILDIGSDRMAGHVYVATDTGGCLWINQDHLDWHPDDVADPVTGEA